MQTKEKQLEENLNKMAVKTNMNVRIRIKEYLKNKISLRDLLSLESGFWNFVCENNLTNQWNDDRFVLDEVEYDSETVRYWLAKSSIQTDLVTFLLESIDWEKLN